MDATDSERNPVEELAEEFIERRRRGEKPSVEEYAGKFPELAGPIRELFPALVMMEKLGAENDFFGEPDPDPRLPSPRSRLEQIGDFRVLREVGRGGMGIVYEAEQESLGRRVALKVLSGHRLIDSAQVRRFEREARSAARLHHTNIVPVFGVGKQDGLHYYVMQFIQGQGLDEVLTELKRLRAVQSSGRTVAVDTSVVSNEGRSVAQEVAKSLLSGEYRVNVSAASSHVGENITPCDHSPSAVASAGGRDLSADSSLTLPGESELSKVVKSELQYARSVARIGVQVAEALEYANTQGIFHRDIKPSNLLLDIKGTVWVTDFGLAKSAEADDLTQTGDIVGTLRYMAPERFRGRCDARADVYSLGLTLYELLALRPAYHEVDRQRLVQLVTQEQPPRLRKLNPAVPRDLATIIHKAIEREPEHRYPTAGALASDMQRFIDDKPIEARRIPPHERLLHWRRRNPGFAALTVAVILLLLAVAGISSVAAVRLRDALGETRAAQSDTNDKLWHAYLAQARAGRLSRQPGQRFDSLRAVREALKLPVPKDGSLADLRAEATACLCVTDDMEVFQRWEACPTGTNVWAVDDAFERYARDDPQGNVSIRRIADDRELLKLPGGGTPIWGYGGLEFSPDGRFLHQVWTVGAGWRARLWRIDAADPWAVIADDHINLAFRPDGRQFAASYPDGSIRFYDAATSREVHRFANISPDPDSMLRWNPRLPQLALLGSAVCRVIDVDSGEIASEISVQGGRSWIDWHPEGRMLAISSNALKIYVHEVASRRLVLPPLEGHKQYGVVMCFNHAGDRLVSNDWSSMIRLWDIRTGRQLLSQPGSGCCLSYSPDDRLLAADLVLPDVRLFRCHTSYEFRTVVLHSAATEGFKGQAVLAHHGRLLAVWTPDGVSLVDVLRAEEVATLPLAGMDPLYFEPGDEALWTSGQNGVLRWPLRPNGGGEQVRVGPPENISSSPGYAYAAASADGQLVCLPQLGAGALVWRRQTDESIVLGPQDDVRHVTVSSDGKWVATGSHGLSAGAGAKVWDGATGRHVADLPAGALCDVRFSPDGRWLVTTGGGPRLWTVGDWKEGPRLAKEPNTGNVCFTPDSQILALGGAPGEVCLVHTETGEELVRLTAPEPTRLVPQAFTPDGTRLVTLGTETGALHIFDLSSIRSQLMELGLDWDAPPLPPSPGSDVERLDVHVELGR
ncbi:MAG TPA: serine/threonine-protein kinase [Pirellulales bacterium]|nr:serine/threonine-protein kinase [Pirellulales bacterium]